MDELKPCSRRAMWNAVTELEDMALHQSVKKRLSAETLAIAIAAISEKAGQNRRPAPENKPLTLEQLRQMDGEPVWVVFAGNVDWPPKAHWCFVRATKCILQVYPCAVHQAKNWLYTEQDFNRGVANAYARKPEGSA